MSDMAISDEVKAAFEKRHGVSIDVLTEDPTRIDVLITKPKAYELQNSYPITNPQEADRRSREIIKDW